MRTGQRIDFAPDGTDVCGLATVEANSFVEDATTHGVFFNIVIVAVNESVLFFKFFSGEFGVRSGVCFFEVFTHGFESFGTGVLLQGLLCDVVAGLIAVGFHLFAQCFVVHFVAVFALHVGAEFLHEFFLELAHGLDGFVSNLEGFEEGAFGHFLHFAFHHHDVFFCGTYHQIHVSGFELCERGVDDILAIDTCNAHFGDGAVEGNVGAGQGGTGGKTCEGIGHVYTVGREECDVDKHFCVVVAREEGTQGAVNEARGQDFVVGSTAFAFGKSAGEASCSGVFFFVIALERHEIGAGGSVFGTADGGKQHGVVHAQHHCAVGLLGQLAGLNADGTTIGQGDGFCNHVHLMCVFFIKCSKYDLNRAKLMIYFY